MAGKAEARRSHVSGVLGEFSDDLGTGEKAARFWASAMRGGGTWFICQWEGKWWAVPPGELADAARANPDAVGYDFEGEEVSAWPQETPAEQFERRYAARSGFTVAELRPYRVVVPCACGEKGCEGFASVPRTEGLGTPL